MKEKPILMRTENYKKCADGTKTQTRRICRNPDKPIRLIDAPCPVGTHLWVKEPFWINGLWGLANNGVKVCYGYDNPPKQNGIVWEGVRLTDEEYKKWWKWKNRYKIHSGMFMFKSLARLWLEVTDVRIERLQEISEADAQAEGLDITKYATPPRTWFRELWDSINKDRASWESNPWVWAYTFKRVRQ